METEQIGTIAKNLVENTFVNRCENCGVRYRRTEDKLCDYCFGRYERERNMTPEKLEKTVLELVEPRYANAVMDNVDSDIREQLRERITCQDVFFWGLPGRGKTYTMAALIRAYIGAGYGCIRIGFDDFCCRVRSTMSPASKLTEWEMTKPLKGVDMLFIDDLGLNTKIATDFAYNTFFLTLNKRQERLLPTFISSNKSPEALRKTMFDARISSRLSEALVIEMNGEDRRASQRA